MAARKLTTNQAKTLQVVIDETRKGCPPNTGTVIAALNDEWAWRVLQSLQRWGYIQQPHPSGAWVPLRDLDGCELRLELVRIERPASSEGSAPGGSPPLDPAGSEGWPA
jgi:hypothetical protein